MAVHDFRQKLADPEYLGQHLLAAGILNKSRRIPWYDAHFLRSFEVAREYLAQARPEAVDEFVAGFAPLRTPPDFSVQRVQDLFSPATQAEIRAIVANLQAEQLELHELESFGRHVVHDHPYFIGLQQELVPLVSKLAGQQVETGYNFLSLYGQAGRCDPHMDEPISMYTLDYCIDQQGDWPINFSRVVDWPERNTIDDWDPQAILDDPAMEFRSEVIHPNDAILFAGSSQWHYRDAMPPGGFCNLLFFHYYPAGCGDLVTPAKWARHFAIPELVALCDLFALQAEETAKAG